MAITLEDIVVLSCSMSVQESHTKMYQSGIRISLESVRTFLSA